jgi:hypothetical protein
MTASRADLPVTHVNVTVVEAERGGLSPSQAWPHSARASRQPRRARGLGGGTAAPGASWARVGRRPTAPAPRGSSRTATGTQARRASGRSRRGHGSPPAAGISYLAEDRPRGRARPRVPRRVRRVTAAAQTRRLTRGYRCGAVGRRWAGAGGGRARSGARRPDTGTGGADS